MAETCQIALQRLRWLTDKKSLEEKLPSSPYASVDPAPPSSERDIETLRRTLMDENKSLFERYRAMFSLRNLGTVESVNALGEGEIIFIYYIL